MEKELLSELINNPHSANASHAEAVDNAINRFPYFATLRTLKAYITRHSANNAEALKTASAYAPVRQVLQSIAHEPEIVENIPAFIAEPSEETPAEETKAEAIEHLEETPAENELEISEEVYAEEPKAEVSEISQEIHTENEPLPEGIVEKAPIEEDKPLLEAEANGEADLSLEHSLMLNESVLLNEITYYNTRISSKATLKALLPHTKTEEIRLPIYAFNKNRVKKTFSDWLEISKTEKYSYYTNEKYLDIPDYVLEPVENISASTENSLIEKFLEKQPSIVVTNDTNYYADFADNQEVELESIATETMAMIFEKQEKWAAAITIYNKLSLQMPEKSLIFADKIKMCKEKLSLA